MGASDEELQEAAQRAISWGQERAADLVVEAGMTAAVEPGTLQAVAVAAALGVLERTFDAMVIVTSREGAGELRKIRTGSYQGQVVEIDKPRDVDTPGE